MNKEIKQKIFDKIREYDTIMLFRHVRPDGDCMGATKGLQAIIKATWPEKQVHLVATESAAYLAFLGKEDPDVSDEVYASALGIVLDTASEARISNKKYKLCKELIKIDHHIPLENYGNLQWVEEERSSCCEMIVAFYDAFREELKIDSLAATHLYTGMVTGQQENCFCQRPRRQFRHLHHVCRWWKRQKTDQKLCYRTPVCLYS